MASSASSSNAANVMTTKRSSALLMKNEQLENELANANQKIKELALEKEIIWKYLISKHQSFHPTIIKNEISNPLPQSSISLQVVEERISSISFLIQFLEILSYNKKNNQNEHLLPDEKRKKVDSAAAELKKHNKVSYDDDGNVILPLKFGIITIHSLGQVDFERPSFHCKRYIWPIGFHSTRVYASTIDPSQQTLYHSRIVDGGQSPIFEIKPEDSPEKIFSASTATGAWSAVMKAANEIRGKDVSSSASGPDYFGLANPIVAKLLEELPGAEKCKNYCGVSGNFKIEKQFISSSNLTEEEIE